MRVTKLWRCDISKYACYDATSPNQITKAKLRRKEIIISFIFGLAHKKSLFLYVNFLSIICIVYFVYLYVYRVNLDKSPRCLAPIWFKVLKNSIHPPSFRINFGQYTHKLGKTYDFFCHLRRIFWERSPPLLSVKIFLEGTYHDTDVYLFVCLFSRGIIYMLSMYMHIYVYMFMGIR